jgi:hypothetical protein
MKRVPLTCVVKHKDSPYTPRQLIRFVIANDARFVANEKALVLAAKIETALALDEQAPFADLEDAHHELICEALANPQPAVQPLTYPLQPAFLLLPMIAEIKAAPDARVEKQANGARAAEHASA